MNEITKSVVGFKVYTFTKKKPLTQSKKLCIYYLVAGLQIPHFCNKLIIWGVGGGGGQGGCWQQLPPPTLPAIYVFAFLLRDHKSGYTKSVEVLAQQLDHTFVCG
jgi:hypothetical protein